MYRIGEFSYLYGVTVKTLRHYDKIDLFKPNYVAPFTGYRYYSDEQKEEFTNILKLKYLNFSLEEIKELEIISGGDDIMDYVIGMAKDRHIDAAGIKVVVEKKDLKSLEKHFEIVKEKLTKLGFKCDRKVIITLEVGYKEEDVELFVGYYLPRTNRLDEKEIKLRDEKDKLGLELWGYPTFDYLCALDVKNENDILKVCSQMIEYANKNKIQIVGPFTEVYNPDGIEIYAASHDLKETPEVLEIRDRKILQERYSTFKDNKEFIGNYKIKEILPYIDFNPERQKSEPNTIYEELSIYENGKTNYENIEWNNNYLLIKDNDKIIINSRMNKIVINNKEYLEIMMNDIYSVYPYARRMTYIYEKID